MIHNSFPQRFQRPIAQQATPGRSDINTIKSSRFQRSTLVVAISGALTLMCAGAAFAQQAPAPAADAVEPTDKATTDAATLDTITVTANKRVENIRKVPLAVSVVSSEQLDNQHATQFTDYAAYIPGLQFTSAGTPGKTGIALRGIAPISSGTTIGTYVDEIQVGSSSLYQQATLYQLDLLPYDIYRVEVLRGPQGTLYGAGSMGGIVKYVTRDPDLSHTEFNIGGGLSDVAGSGDLGWDARFGANMPLSDQVGMRVSYARNALPGYVDNAFDGRKDINEGTQESARAALLWQLNDDVSLHLTALGQTIDSDNNAMVALDPATQQPQYGDLTNFVRTPEPFSKEIGILAATLDWNLGWADFTSASGYTNVSTRQLTDASTQYGQVANLLLGLPEAGIAPFDAVLNLHKFSQEFRLTSKPGTPLLWQVGAYYTKETATQDQTLTLQQADGTALPGPFAVYGTIAVLGLPSTYKETALFGNASYQFTDRFNVGVGVRYASNDQDFSQDVTGGFLLPLGSSPGSSSEDIVTWHVAPQFKLSEDALLYARVATGYEPGGPNVASPDVPPQVDSSTLISYELGLKSEFAEHRVLFDIAAFDIDWKDLQVGTATSSNLQYITNGGKATSQGVEVTTAFRPTDNLRLGLIGTWTDAKLGDEVTPLNASGNRLPYIPTFSASATADYYFPLGGWDGHVGGGYRWVGDREGDIQNQTQTQLDSYGAFDLNADVSNVNWTIRAYLKNATDKRAYLNKADINDLLGVTDRISAVPIQPRTFGVEVDYKF